MYGSSPERVCSRTQDSGTESISATSEAVSSRVGAAASDGAVIRQPPLRGLWLTQGLVVGLRRGQRTACGPTERAADSCADAAGDSRLGVQTAGSLQTVHSSGSGRAGTCARPAAAAVSVLAS